MLEGKEMRKMWTAVLAVVLALCLFGCGGGVKQEGDNAGVGSDGKVTIEFFGWGDAEELANYQTLVNKFMADNPDIIVSYAGESSTTYMTTLKQRAQALPDIFYMPDYDYLEWVKNNTLKDITEYVSEEELSQLWPQAVDLYHFNRSTKKLGKSEGSKLYGLPKDLGPFTLVYNKSLLDEIITANGLDSNHIYNDLLDPTDPMTWNEFRDLLKSLKYTKGNQKIWGISHYELEAAVYSNNADFFDEGAKNQTITDPRFTEAVQFIADLYLEDDVMPSSDDQASTNGYQRFSAQGCVFSFMGPWDNANFWKTTNFEYDIAPVPYNGENPDAESTAWVGSMAYCIKSNCGKAKTEACIKLAKYLCYNESAQREFYKLGQQVPNIREMANNEYLNDTQGVLANKSPKSRAVWLDTISGTNEKIHGKVRTRYYTLKSDWYGLLTEHFTTENMWSNKNSAASACQSFASTLQAALDAYSAELG